MTEGSPPSPPQPTAHGDLGSTPLAHVVVTIARRNLSGTLAVWPEVERRGQDRVRFIHGQPHSAVLLDPADTLERGLLPLFQRTAVPYAFYEVDLVTGSAGAIEQELDAYHLVAAACRGGVRDEVMEGILSRFGTSRLRLVKSVQLDRFGFAPKERAVVQLLRAEPQSLATLIGRSPDAKTARRVAYLLSITNGVEVYKPAGGQAASHQTPSAAEDLPTLPEDPGGDDHGLPGLSEPPGEAAPARSGKPIARSLPPRPGSLPPRRGSLPPRPASMPPRGGTSPGQGSPTAVAGDQREPPPPAPADLSGEDRARWSEIAAYWVAVDDLNYFEMLEVATSASENDVRDAYFAKVKTWHPDRLSPALEPIRSYVEAVFHHLTEAQKTLADVEKRAAYFKTVQSGGGTPRADRRLAVLLNAALEYQKVEVLVRRKDYHGAMTILDSIITAAPEEPDYHAMRGEVLLKIHGASDKAKAADALAALDQALQLHERHEKALMTKAHILQRIGSDKEANEIYALVAQINPKNRDAERQVRLAAMRSGSSKQSNDSGGFFSRFFGGDKKK